MLPQVNLVRAKHGDFLAFFETAGISNVLSAYGVWDEVSVAIAKAMLDIQPNLGAVIDVGANMGTFTVPLAKHILEKGGVVHSFEPQRIVYYQLCGNIFLNELPNVYAHNVALSVSQETREIDELDFQRAWNIGAYSLVPGHDKQEKLKLKQKCQFARLDDFDLNSRISLIKIDVEGMELDVLEGGLGTIAANGFPPILFECLPGNSRATALYGLLINLGYRLMKYGEADWIAQHPSFPSEIELKYDGAQKLISVIAIRGGG